MSYLINNQQKINDVIFAKRNKSYGAYAIRSTYGNTVFKSLFFMFLGFGTFMSVAFYLSNRNNNDQSKFTGGQISERDSTIIVEYKTDDPASEKRKEVPAEKPKQNASAENASQNLRVIDSLALATSTVVNNQITSTQTGSVSDGPETPVSTTVASGGGGENKTGGGTGKVNGNYEVDSGPEFEGGLSALYKFVAKHVKYPEDAVERGKEGTVFVKFVVDERGRVGSLSLLNNVGAGLDEEALRVVAMIPDFKTPAKIKGEAVKVYYQLPIKFKLR